LLTSSIAAFSLTSSEYNDCLALYFTQSPINSSADSPSAVHIVKTTNVGIVYGIRAAVSGDGGGGVSSNLNGQVTISGEERQWRRSVLDAGC